MWIFKLVLLGFAGLIAGEDFFECFYVKESIDKILAGKFDLQIEKCLKSPSSTYFQACKTDFIDGIIYSGCMNSSDWHKNYLCSPMSDVREYSSRQDTMGVFIYENSKSWCCREPLCNNANYFQSLKNFHERPENLEQQIFSNITVILSFFIGFLILLGLEKCMMKPKFGDFL